MFEIMIYTNTVCRWETQMTRVVIFDFDGVIADTENIHLGAFREILAPRGIEISERDYYSEYLALDDKAFFTVLLEKNGFDAVPETVAQLIEKKSLVISSAMEKCDFFDGAENLIRSLAGIFPLAIASGALRKEIDSTLRRGDLLDSFCFIASAEDSEKCKPDPEIFIRALRGVNENTALNPPAQAGQCVVIEDSPHGIAAAKAAGMRCVAVAHSNPRETLWQADIVADSVLDIAPEGLKFEF